MLDARTLQRYHDQRRKTPLLPASHALVIAKTPNYSKQWEESRDTFTRTVEGFTITLRVDDESIYPADGDGYGAYMREARDTRFYYSEMSQWEGQYPKPAGTFPMGLPYTVFRYSGPGWHQSEEPGYFVPDGIEDHYAYLRKSGQSRSVARDMTAAWAQDTVRAFFHSPMTNCYLDVAAWRAGVKLGTAGIGTTYLGDEREYVFECVEEHALIDEAVAAANAKLKELCAA